jgi:hypothetical protein
MINASMVDVPIDAAYKIVKVLNDERCSVFVGEEHRQRLAV